MSLPTLCIADRKPAAVEHAKKIGLGDEWYPGWDPLEIPNIDAIVSPANTIGEMSGGYDLTLRNAFQHQKIAIQPIVQNSLHETPITLGEARIVRTGGKIPWLIVVPTVIGKNDNHGKMQSRTPHSDILVRGTYNLMREATNFGVQRIGTVLLGAGVGGINYLKVVEAMAEGYFEYLDEFE
jgi:O-acetyl-ADP-ribose deacetylase (regulator of RNase III)